MAKTKKTGVSNRHIYSRISFLYQAATYLTEAGQKETPHASSSQKTHSSENNGPAGGDDAGGLATQDPATPQKLSRQLLTDLRNVTLKSQVRISPDIKRSICKYCDSLLVDGQTSSSAVENRSKGGRKPWADVLVVKCYTCGGEKRFPVHAEKQKRRPNRAAATKSQQQSGT
ncbi:Rpr2-domain-containing protein [Cryphonectria parasitica EP155]|uniref:Rpr2-domain-containing protein n=1 Tax=Cryphonectria parasitica (strain ATCC 38755 / EP155) TaxID=660469 RepID=A0A9P4Y9E6_CRYP1|nr:Rpr2-domain-containing protein [Cryphonectria parasitica EP155]KAF3768762.1 Rpr2-domain-containing protein [Cryphonectria parasitica EP155]